MDITTDSVKFQENRTFDTITVLPRNSKDVIRIVRSSIACVGIISNLVVIIVFLKDKLSRRKIPNIFIINQVREIKAFVQFLICAIQLI